MSLLHTFQPLLHIKTSFLHKMMKIWLWDSVQSKNEWFDTCIGLFELGKFVSL